MQPQIVTIDWDKPDTPEAVSWLWEPYVPRDSLAILEGDPGLGKSLLTCWLAARLSRGQLGRPPANVLLLSGEDHPFATVRPRLQQLGADLHRVRLVAGVAVETRRAGVSLEDHYLALMEYIIANHVKLIVIDPLAVFVTRICLTYETGVRIMLSRYRLLAEQAGCTFLFVRHLGKQAGRPALYRGTGSIGLVAAARVALALRPGLTPDERVLVCLKNNLAPNVPALRLRFQNGQVDPVAPARPADLAAASAADPAMAAARLQARVQHAELHGQPPHQVVAKLVSEGFAERAVRRALAFAGWTAALVKGHGWRLTRTSAATRTSRGLGDGPL